MSHPWASCHPLQFRHTNLISSQTQCDLDSRAALHLTCVAFRSRQSPCMPLAFLVFEGGHGGLPQAGRNFLACSRPSWRDGSPSSPCVSLYTHPQPNPARSREHKGASADVHLPWQIQTKKANPKATPPAPAGLSHGRVKIGGKSRFQLSGCFNKAVGSPWIS